MNGGLVGDLGASRRAAAKWNDLGRRVLPASLLAPAALLCVWFGGPAYAALVALAGVGLALEWVWLCGASPLRWPGMGVPALVLASALVGLGTAKFGLALVLIGFGLLWASTRRPKLAAGILYVGIPLIALLWLRLGKGEAGRATLVFLLLVVWASDIGAYATGRMLGGPKLAPALSPGKTWSGAIGGLAAAVIVGLLAAWLLGGAATAAAALIAALLGVATQAGDLLESGIKRHFGVKDSGWLIPGHGGLLDRLDGLLAAASVAALAVLMGPGEVLWQ